MSNGYLGSGGFDPSSYMLKKLLEEMFGGGDDAELKEMQKELTKLRLEGARDPSNLNTIEKRLDAFAGSTDLTNPKNLEKVYTQINTALNAGMFGEKPENVEFVKNYLGGLTTTSTLLTDVSDKRKELYNNTNSSYVARILDSAMMNPDTSKAVETIENEIYDLTENFDFLEDRGKLGSAQANRYSNALKQYDNILKELGTDGLTEQELKSIKNSTYATVKTAETALELEMKKFNVLTEFQSPNIIDAELLKSLTNFHTKINDYDDFIAEKTANLTYSNILESSALGTSSPENQLIQEDIMTLHLNRDERLLQRYAESYQKIYDKYKDNRKTSKTNLSNIDFTEIMDSKLHGELYNFPTTYNKKIDINNNNFPILRPKNKNEEKKVISNMLSKRNINIIDDIYDENNVLWSGKDKQFKGMGAPGKSTWEIDSIQRYDNGELSNIRIKIPGTIPKGTGLGYATFTDEKIKELFGDRYINLNPDNFIIEDDLNLFGAGYRQNSRYGKMSYNIMNNLYEQVK